AGEEPPIAPLGRRARGGREDAAQDRPFVFEAGAARGAVGRRRRPPRPPRRPGLPGRALPARPPRRPPDTPPPPGAGVARGRSPPHAVCPCTSRSAATHMAASA